MPRNKTAPTDRKAGRDRREDQRLAIREKILNAATTLLIGEGIAGFSMRKLAEQVGYTATTLYIHFPDREGLLGEVVDRQFFRFRNNFERIGRIPDPLARLQAMGEAFVRFGLQHPDLYRFMFLTSLTSIPKGKFVEKGNPSQDCYAFLLATVTEGLRTGRYRPDCRNPEELAQIFFAGVHGIVALHLEKGGDDWVAWTPIRPRAKKLIAALIRGLKAPDREEPAVGHPPKSSRKEGS